MITHRTYPNEKPGFRAPNSKLASAGAICQDAAAVKPGKVRHWSLQKNLPWFVKAHRAEAIEKQKMKDIMQKYRGDEKPTSKFLVVKKTKTGYRGIGFDEVVPTFAEIKAFAKSIGRSFVRMGAVKCSV